MFGQDNNQQQSDQNGQQPVEQSQPTQVLSNDFAQSTAAPALVEQPFTPAADPVASPAQNDWQTPIPAATSEWVAPAAGSVVPGAYDTPAQNDTLAGDDLMAIKQKALTELSPLIGHLDQTPEEKFKTTMMMIQASDDQGLIPDAYAAAQAITGEKAKAQALLDIVNEINYFTQHVS